MLRSRRGERGEGDSAITMLLSRSQGVMYRRRLDVELGKCIFPNMDGRGTYSRVDHIWKLRIEDAAHCLSFIMPDDLSGNLIRIKYKWEAAR